jgi:exo-beta-1,3-glucanase (GH17 family)
MAMATTYAWLDGDTVAYFEVVHSRPNFCHHATGLMANDHGFFQYKNTAPSMGQVVDVRATNADTVHFQQDLVV